MEVTKQEATRINDTWSFWYTPRGRKIVDNDDYFNNLKKLGTFTTIFSFFEPSFSFQATSTPYKTFFHSTAS